MGIARSASELAGMSFENKISVANYKTLLKDIDTEAETKIFLYKQEKQPKSSFCRKCNP